MIIVNMKTILIVDDEPDLREILRLEFEAEGWNVIEAENGTKAFETFQNSKIDAVASDVRMPGGDGVSLLEKIKAVSPKTPVVLLTGFADIQEKDALAKGALAMVKKPFDLVSVISLINGALPE